MNDSVCAIASLPVCFGECLTIVSHLTHAMTRAAARPTSRSGRTSQPHDARFARMASQHRPLVARLGLVGSSISIVAPRRDDRDDFSDTTRSTA